MEGQVVPIDGEEESLRGVEIIGRRIIEREQQFRAVTSSARENG
jgi:hypothetical protein